MNPVLLSALHGLFKGLVVGPATKRTHDAGYANFGAPIVEEVLYRAIPMGIAGKSMPKGLSAAVFAADHVRGEPGAGPGRLADVFAGGLLYEQAFRQYGILGAIGGHMLHNLFVTVGRGPGHVVPKKRSNQRRVKKNG